MKKKVTELIVCLLAVICFLTACHTPQSEKLADGTYQADVTLTGGSGRATVDSPAALTVEGGKIYATIVWSSPYYDYMMVEDETYYNEAEAGENSTFTIPLEKLPCEISVIGDTTAMSVPHEIEYTLSFTLKETDFSELTKTGQWDLSYATQYQVEQYGKYDLITIADSRFLLVPENVPVPEHVPEDVVVLKQPLDHTYLVSSSVMDMIREIGALSDVRLTGVKESDWYIEEAASAMKSGSMLYAGKYNEPDYELILKEGCNFALENTMIGHNPEVKEKLESLGIPVMVERSSYEEHPLGRLEWIRLYGLLYGKEQEADAFYEEQLKKIEPIMEKEDTGRTVAFFYITANGAVNVRKPNDYIAQMIGLAGGTYVLNDRLSAEENALSTMNMQMEDFYAAAKDADILIYNSTIEGELYSVDELLAKSTLFSDFKAVKEGNVYCTGSNFFQESTGTCDFIEDLHKVLADETDENYRFLKHVR